MERFVDNLCVKRLKLSRLDLHALARATRDRLLPDLATRATPNQLSSLEAEFELLTRDSLEDVPLFALHSAKSA